MQRIVSVLLVSLLLIGCSSARLRHSIPFAVTEASYYTWFVSEAEKGTMVMVSLSDVRDGVMFDSLVFRAMKMPVVTETIGDSVVVKAVLSGIESAVENRALPDGGLNRLVYTWKGKRHSYEIEEFTREDSRYLIRE